MDRCFSDYQCKVIDYMARNRRWLPIYNSIGTEHDAVNQMLKHMVDGDEFGFIKYSENFVIEKQ